MIAGIMSGFEGEYDFEVFLTKKEITELERRILEGIAIDIVEPESRKSLRVSVDDGKTASTNFRRRKKVFLYDIVIEGVGTNNYCIFVSQNYYAKLKESGCIGGRYGLHKIDIIEETLADEGGIYYEEFGKGVRLIRQYLNHL